MNPWYAKVHVWVTVMISAMAIAMVGLAWLLTPTSNEIIRQAQRQLVNAKSFAATVNVSFRPTTTDRAAWRLESSGVYDRRKSDQLVTQQDFSLWSNADGRGEPDWSGEYRRVAATDNIFFRATPETFGTADLANYRDRWLKFDSRQLRQWLATPIIGQAGSVASVDRIYLENRFADTPFFQVTHELKKELVDGIKSYHFAVEPDLIYVSDFLMRVEAIRLGRELTAREREKFGVFFADVRPQSGDIWISRRDVQFRRVQLLFDYVGNSGAGTLTVSLEFRDFGVMPSVTVPETAATEVGPIIRSLLPGLVGGLRPADVGSSGSGYVSESVSGLPVYQPFIDSDPDKDGLEGALEYFYGTDPNNPDTDGDGVSDGDEVARGDNPTGSGRLFDFGRRGN